MESCFSSVAQFLELLPSCMPKITRVYHQTLFLTVSSLTTPLDPSSVLCIDRRTDKDVVHIYKGTLLSHKRDEIE